MILFVMAMAAFVGATALFKLDIKIPDEEKVVPKKRNSLITSNRLPL